MDRLRAEYEESPTNQNETSLYPDDPAGTETETREDPVEEASDDSFPASDPPSFTGSSASNDTETPDPDEAR